MVHIPHALSGEVKGSFAYLTIKDRLPVILTKVIDHLCREKLTICAEYGEEATEEIKLIVGQLSQLKNELQTNKSLKFFPERNLESDHNDDEIWNATIQSYQNVKKSDLKWFTTSWIFAECYFYKKIHSIFSSSQILANYDPFKHQKIAACKNSLESMTFLSEYLMKIIQSKTRSKDEDKDILFEMIQVSLWGNQCDLSLSSGEEFIAGGSLLARLDNMKENILVSNLDKFWKHLTDSQEEKRHIAIILDNAGLELFADFCLATILVELKFTESITFYTKTRPWFVSDTTISDLNWTLQYLKDQTTSMSSLSSKFSEYFENRIWKIREDKFWTLSYSYSEMQIIDPNLYEEMKSFSTIIFKGDLNYRKLVGDLDWPINGQPKFALRGFLPSSLLMLRTIKGGPVVGLDNGSSEVIKAKSKDNWNISGEFGMIQFVSNKFSFNFKEVSLWIASIVSAIFISYLLKNYMN